MKKLSLDALGRLSVEEFKQVQKNPIIIILDDIRSLNNIGSFFRTADAFAIESIYLCGITACPPHREMHKTALGATETVHWEYFSDVADAIMKAKSMQYEIVCVEQTDCSIPLHQFKPAPRSALIFGNEVEGVSEKAVNQSERAVEIPQQGTKHSLNVSVCGGILLWHLISSQM